MVALLVPVGDDTYAIPLHQVREVVSAPELTALPTSPATVLGLLNLRGGIVPVLDPAALLELGQVEAVAFAVVVDTPAGPAALAATGLPRSVELDEPVAASEPPGVATYAAGAGLATLLDLGALLAPNRIGEAR